MFLSNSITLKVGDDAPDFKLFSPNKDREFTLSEFKGRPLIIAFYPNNIGFVCKSEVCSFRDQFDQFEQFGANVVCVSSNTVESHLKFASDNNVNFPILCDLDGKVGVSYGANGKLPSSWVFNYGRATFVIDKNGKIALNHSTSWFTHASHIDESLKVVKYLNSLEST